MSYVLSIYEAIYSRRTVRDFKDKEIVPEVIEKLIGAGMQAPSNNHMRQWEFVVVNDKTIRLNLIDILNKNETENDAIATINNWGLTDEFQREMYIDAIPKQYRMILNAGCLIIPCFRQKKPPFTVAGISDLNSFASIWCCIENILLAAVNEGIYGVTRIPCINGESTYIKDVLKIPEDYEIPCYIALGYPDENAKFIRQHSIKPEERIHYNKF